MAVNVTVGNRTGIGQVTVTQPVRSTVVAQNFKPKPNVALVELTDVTIESLQDGEVITYNSDDGKFVIAPINQAQINLRNIVGGSF